LLSTAARRVRRAHPTAMSTSPPRHPDSGSPEVEPTGVAPNGVPVGVDATAVSAHVDAAGVPADVDPTGVPADVDPTGVPARVDPSGAPATAVSDAPTTPAPAAASANGALGGAGAAPVARTPRRLARLTPQSALGYLALAPILALSIVLNTNRLSKNAYANVFYSAGVKSMLGSFHNFFFNSFDPGGLITVDKPPLALWVQAISAKLFGFSPLSLLLPNAIVGVIGVAVLYLLMRRPFGQLAALAGALTLAVFPSYVASSRDNGVDLVLILLMTLACGAALRAIRGGRWPSLLACAVLVGLAFNTKTLAAYLVVPGIGLGYLLCAPDSFPRRLGKLLVAGVLMLAVSFAWIGYVEATPASHRPYVGGSTDNTELGLTFDYNGLGRVEGEVGGPGQIFVKLGAVAPFSPAYRTALHLSPKRTRAPKTPTPNPILPDGHYASPTPFGVGTGPLRLFEAGLGDQGGWMLPFALLGMLALALAILSRRTPPDPRDVPADGSRWLRLRRDPRTAGLIVLGCWFLVEALILSFSKGIVHPYYTSALGPGTAAMVGAGVGSFARFARGRDWRLVLLPLAVAGTVAAQLVLLHRAHYMHWYYTPLVIAAAAGTVAVLAALAVRRLAVPAMIITLLALTLAPTVYAATTWSVPVEGTFPAAGPKVAGALGPYGVTAHDVKVDRDMMHYIDTHGSTHRWELLTVSSNTAATPILLGYRAGALGGYSGTDPAVNGSGLARMVAKHEARYVVLGGAYSSRGGNLATLAVIHACREIPTETWLHFRRFSVYSLVLYDCGGRARQLAAQA
jgi:4-amino-4-deoxy-L-arabinose transferase-like glycosyltransferase